MKKILFLACTALALGGCYNDKFDKLYVTPSVDVCDTATNPSTYSGNVKKIMDQSCNESGCHDAGSASGGYDLTSYAGVKAASDDGVLMSDIISGRMPKGGAAKLSDCNIKQIQYWVNHGAQNN